MFARRRSHHVSMAKPSWIFGCILIEKNKAAEKKTINITTILLASCHLRSNRKLSVAIHRFVPKSYCKEHSSQKLLEWTKHPVSRDQNLVWVEWINHNVYRFWSAHDPSFFFVDQKVESVNLIAQSSSTNDALATELTLKSFFFVSDMHCVPLPYQLRLGLERL